MHKYTTIAGAFIDAVHALGVDKVFLVPGAQITPLMIALEEHETVMPIVAAHELGAAFMAMGYARATGKLGVVFSIGGPGASYMMGAAVTAKMDDTPVVFVTGNIPFSHEGLGEFQDSGPSGSNDCKIYKEAVGESLVCHAPEDFPRVLEQIYSAWQGHRPLHIQFPVDIQSAVCSATLAPLEPFRQRLSGNPVSWHDKKRVILFLGRYCVDQIDNAKLTDFVERSQIAVVTDLTARGVVSEESRCSLGFVGLESDPRALDALCEESENRADVVVVIGVKPETIRRYLSSEIEMKMTTIDDLHNLMDRKDSEKADMLKHRANWIASLVSKKRIIPEPNENDSLVSYRALFNNLKLILPRSTKYCLDAGLARRAGTILLTCTKPKTITQSETLAPMGYGVCSAIGVKTAFPDATVVSIFGDGTMRMHGIEIATAVRYKLPITFVLLDNQSYGSILKREGMQSYAGLPETNWGAFAASLGISCVQVHTSADLPMAIQRCYQSNETTLLWVQIGKKLDPELYQAQAEVDSIWLNSVK